MARKRCKPEEIVAKLRQVRDLKKARLAEITETRSHVAPEEVMLRQKLADAELSVEYVRRHTDHNAKIAEQYVPWLHANAAPQAEQGNWDPMKLLLTIGWQPKGTESG